MELPPTSIEVMAKGLAANTNPRLSPAEAFASLGLPGPNHDLPSDGLSAGPSRQSTGYDSQRASKQSSVPTIFKTEGATAQQQRPSPYHLSSQSVTSSSETDYAEATEPHSTVPDIKIACQNCKRRKTKCSGRPNLITNLSGLQCDSCAENGDECVWTPSHRPPPRNKSRKSSKTTSHDGTALVQITSACNACAKRKQRCSGDRPTCRYCHERGFDECVYEVSEGMTRSEDLKDKLVRFNSYPKRRLDGLDERISYHGYFCARVNSASKLESITMAFS